LPCEHGRRGKREIDYSIQNRSKPTPKRMIWCCSYKNHHYLTKEIYHKGEMVVT